ncbi:MAG: glycosyltransferase family 2 protein, partial [Psychrobacter sp.]
MQFSDSSDITLVITSCGRFDLLKRTLESLDKYIEYPIMKVIITEDSGSSDVHLTIPEQWKLHTDVIINDVKLGQLASIDK